MGALATLNLPLRLTTSNDRYDAGEILANIAGAQDVTIEDSQVTLSIQMPGNIDSIVGKLRSKKLLGTGTTRVSVPMRSLAIPDKPASPQAMLEKVGWSPLIRDASFHGDRFEATIVPSTAAMFVIYDAALHAGLIAQDVPTLVALRGL